MPKFTDLPIATTAKDNDIFSIVDPDANESRQIDLETLRRTIAGIDILYGAASQGLSLPTGGALQKITGYGSVFPAAGGNGDPFLGEITIAGNTTGLVRVSASIELLLSSPSNTDNNYFFYMRKFDGATNTDILIDAIFTTNNSLTSILFKNTFISQVSDGDILSLYLSSESLAQTVDVVNSSFSQEAI